MGCYLISLGASQRSKHGIKKGRSNQYLLRILFKASIKHCIRFFITAIVWMSLIYRFRGEQEGVHSLNLEKRQTQQQRWGHWPFGPVVIPFFGDAGGQGFNPCLPQLATLRGWSLPPRDSSSGPLPLPRVWRPSWLVQGSNPAVNVFGVEWDLLSRAAGN